MRDGVMPQIGREVRLYALGKYWTLPRREMEVWQRLYEWAKPRLPDPFEALDRLANKIPAGAGPDHPLAQIYEREFPKAQAKANELKSISSPEFLNIIDNTIEGKVQQFYELLRIHPGQENVTLTEAVMILNEIGEQQAQKELATVDGRLDPLPNSTRLAQESLNPSQAISVGKPSSTT